MKEKYSEAQKKADEKWRKENKEHANYLRARSAARSFIKNKATEEDIEKLEQLLLDRKKELKQI